MKLTRPFVFACTLTLLGSATWADDAQHPEKAASAAKPLQAAAPVTKAPRPAASSEAAKATVSKTEGFGVLTEIGVQASVKNKLGIDVPARRLQRVCAALA